jgi:hypothetical protein
MYAFFTGGDVKRIVIYSEDLLSISTIIEKNNG